jgi:1-acyl-sn-glycerol-3-phosphate acyltransferase
LVLTVYKIISKLAFSIANLVLRVIYPPKVIWEDKEKSVSVLKKSCLVFSNHTGHLDGLYMAELLKKYRVHTFVAREYYDKKNLNWLFSNLPYIPIDRKEMDTSWLALGEEKLAEGCPVYMFPEGKTRKDGELTEFKPGFLMLAKKAEVPVVPVAIVNNFKKLHRTYIVIGAPMELDLNEEGRPSIVLKKHSETCRQKIIELKSFHQS